MKPKMAALTDVSPRVYACCRCGARSYHRVIDRDLDGAMRPTGRYRCSGCSAVFADPKAWRDDAGELEFDPQWLVGWRRRGFFSAV